MNSPVSVLDRAPRTAVEDPITVAYVWNQYIYQVGDRFYGMTPNILDLMLAFQRHAGRLVVCAPCRTAAVPPEHSELIPPEIEVFPLPWYSGNFDLIRRSPQLFLALTLRLLPVIRRWDAVGADAPSGFGMAAVILATLMGRTGFMYVRGFLTRMLRSEHARLTVKGALIVGGMYPLDLASRVLSHAGMLTFGLGPELAGRHQGPRLVQVHGYARPEVVGKVDPPPVDPESLNHIVYVGRLSGEKGVIELLDAFAAVARENPAAALRVVGDGPEAANLRALAQDLGLAGRVTFTGNVADPAEVRAQFLSGGIAVIPSHTDGVAVSMMEAMALGRATIATAVGGNPTVLHDGENGLLIPPMSAEAIAAAIRRLQADPRLARRLAEGALRAGRSLTMDDQAATMMAVVRRCVRGGKP